VRHQTLSKQSWGKCSIFRKDEGYLEKELGFRFSEKKKKSPKAATLHQKKKSSSSIQIFSPVFSWALASRHSHIEHDGESSLCIRQGQLVLD